MKKLGSSWTAVGSWKWRRWKLKLGSRGLWQTKGKNRVYWYKARRWAKGLCI